MARFAEFYASSMQGARAPRIGFTHYLELSTRLRAIFPGEWGREMIGVHRHRQTPDEDCRLGTTTIALYPGDRPSPAVPVLAVPKLAVPKPAVPKPAVPKPAVPKPAVPILVGD